MILATLNDIPTIYLCMFYIYIGEVDLPLKSPYYAYKNFLSVVKGTNWCVIVPNVVFTIERTVVHITFAQVRVCIHRESCLFFYFFYFVTLCTS